MGSDAVLLIAVLVLQVATLGVVGYGIYRRAVDDGGDSAQIHERLREDLREVERRLDSRLDLVLGQLLNLGSRAHRERQVAEVADPESEELDEEGDREAEEDLQGETEDGRRAMQEMPFFWDPRRRAAGNPVNRLKNLLNATDFLDSVWHGMDGPFDEAAGILVEYLTAQGMAQPSIKPHPPVEPEAYNHWRFVVLSSDEPGSDECRILVPRHFDRYDPALHRHLFLVRGDQSGVDKNLRELRRCAALKKQGALEGFIGKGLVEEKGILVL